MVERENRGAAGVDRGGRGGREEREAAGICQARTGTISSHMKHSTRTEDRDPQEEPSAMAWSLTTITLSPLGKGTSRHNNDTASTTAHAGLHACCDYFCLPQMRQRGKAGPQASNKSHSVMEA